MSSTTDKSKQVVLGLLIALALFATFAVIGALVLAIIVNGLGVAAYFGLPALTFKVALGINLLCGGLIFGARGA